MQFNGPSSSLPRPCLHLDDHTVGRSQRPSVVVSGNDRKRPRSSSSKANNNDVDLDPVMVPLDGYVRVLFEVYRHHQQHPSQQQHRIEVPESRGSSFLAPSSSSTTTATRDGSTTIRAPLALVGDARPTAAAVAMEEEGNEEGASRRWRRWWVTPHSTSDRTNAQTSWSVEDVHRTLCCFAEPKSRPALVHEYHITVYSLGAAASRGMTSQDVVSFLDTFAHPLMSRATPAAATAADVAPSSSSSSPNAISTTSIGRWITHVMREYEALMVAERSDGRVVLQFAPRSDDDNHHANDTRIDEERTDRSVNHSNSSSSHKVLARLLTRLFLDPRFRSLLQCRKTTTTTKPFLRAPSLPNVVAATTAAAAVNEEGVEDGLAHSFSSFVHQLDLCFAGTADEWLNSDDDPPSVRSSGVVGGSPPVVEADMLLQNWVGQLAPNTLVFLGTIQSRRGQGGATTLRTETTTTTTWLALTKKGQWSVFDPSSSSSAATLRRPDDVPQEEGQRLVLPKGSSAHTAIDVEEEDDDDEGSDEEEKDVVVQEAAPVPISRGAALSKNTPTVSRRAAQDLGAYLWNRFFDLRGRDGSGTIKVEEERSEEDGPQRPAAADGMVLHLSTVDVVLLDYDAGRRATEYLHKTYGMMSFRQHRFSVNDERDPQASRLEITTVDPPRIDIVLKHSCRPRAYQWQAARAVVQSTTAAEEDVPLPSSDHSSREGRSLPSHTNARSGVLVLPCGAGKTVVGLLITTLLKRLTLVVCAGAVSVEQWKAHYLEHTMFHANRPDDGTPSSSVIAPSPPIACITGKQKDYVTSETCIVITTYSMLCVALQQLRRSGSTTRTRSSYDDSNANPAAAAGAMENQEQRSHVMAELSNGGKTIVKKRPKKLTAKEALFERSWGLVILDECHMVPADVFRNCLHSIRSHCTVGLTATYVREDVKINDLFYLIGPKLFDVSAESLRDLGYLANCTCVEIRTSMSDSFLKEYTRVLRDWGVGAASSSTNSSSSNAQLRAAPLLQLLAAANPNKFLCALELIYRHLHSDNNQQQQQQAKILLFCDHVALLKLYGEILRAPVIFGGTSHKDRLQYFTEFLSTTTTNVLCLSRVGDVSVNLPSANIVIQVSSHYGSRRQEAQRLGRILRPKAVSSSKQQARPATTHRTGSSIDSGLSRMAFGQSEDLGDVIASSEALFYSIVSTGTVEVEYANHRTAFLRDQGFPCRVLELSFDVPSASMMSLPPTAAAVAVGVEPPSTTTVAPPTRATRGGSGSVGDAALLKREALFRDFGGNAGGGGGSEESKPPNALLMMHPAVVAGSDAVTVLDAQRSRLQRQRLEAAWDGARTVRSPPWQLRLLTLVVSRWELDARNQPSERGRRVTLPGEEEDDEFIALRRQAAEREAAESVGIGRMTKTEILQEMTTFWPMGEEYSDAHRNMRGGGDSGGSAVALGTILDDGVVYHEL